MKWFAPLAVVGAASTVAPSCAFVIHSLPNGRPRDGQLFVASKENNRGKGFEKPKGSPANAEKFVPEEKDDATLFATLNNASPPKTPSPPNMLQKKIDNRVVHNKEANDVTKGSTANVEKFVAEEEDATMNTLSPPKASSPPNIKKEIDNHVAKKEPNDVIAKEIEELKDVIQEEEEVVTEQNLFDIEQMQQAIHMARSAGGERGAAGPYPKPIAGALIVTKDGIVLGRGRSDYQQDAVRAAIADAGIQATPLNEWVVSWPSNRQLREAIAQSTLYVTLEPSAVRHGEALPPITQLIEQSGIPRVVIGCPDPIPERATKGASILHSAGLEVTMGIDQEECERMIEEYTELANSKLQVQARKHSQRFGRPLGFLHCSVVDSDDAEAFARHGNAFGKNFGGKHLSYREFGSYGIAPPPELVWAADTSEEDDFETELDDIFNMEFDEEDDQGSMGQSPMMPWYEQVDAVVATFPKPGNGPSDDNSVTARLQGLKWFATVGEELPANVERILVMDATDLPSLPLTNDDPNLPRGVDVEKFWRGEGRKPTRVLLRRGENAQAQAAAKAAAGAAQAAALAAERALEMVETGDAAEAAELALECQDAATEAAAFIRNELQAAQNLKRKLTKQGVIVETIKGGEPLDVMKHLGKRNAYESVVWRAGCWGERGVQSILADAFQWVSAHLAVDAVGGKFWQLMLAEQAVRAACGPERKVKIFADQEDISMEYCDDVEADKDCTLTVDGRPVRHVRLDCRIALVDSNRPREFQPSKTAKLSKKGMKEQAPWFL